jgi:iron-sulfur cluster repair protein YtfE (RIC family)
MSDLEKKFSDDPIYQALIECIMLSLEEGYKNDLEPFELYAQKLLSQIHSDRTTFCNRIVDGYAILLEELSKKKD